MTPEQFKRRYKSVEDLPAHIFTDRELSAPVGEELRAFLQFLLDNEPEALRYLHRKGQEYIDYGGANVLSWTKWLGQLRNNLRKGNT